MDIKLLQQAANRVGEKISIIIPCYNREKYIRECMDSVLSQTFPMDLLEIIVIDDCSTDRTYSILKEYEEKHPDNIILIENEEQSGGYIGKVRNIGINYASGGYLFFMDSDDRLEENAIEKLYIQAVLQNADVVECNFCMFDEKGIIGTSKKDTRIFDTSDKNMFAGLILEDGMDGWVWGKLYRRAFLAEYNIWFPEDQHVAEDTVFHLSCLMLLSRLVNLEDVLYYYRNHQAGAWNSGGALQNIPECMDAQVKLLPLYFERGSIIRPQIEWLVYGSIYGMKKKCEELGDKEFFEQMIPDIKGKLISVFPDIKDNTLIHTDTSDLNKELLSELFGEKI